MKVLGPELRQLRERKGLSVREAAELAAVSRSALSSIERGLRYPSLDTLERLAAALNFRLVIGPDETLIEEP